MPFFFLYKYAFKNIRKFSASKCCLFLPLQQRVRNTPLPAPEYHKEKVIKTGRLNPTHPQTSQAACMLH